MRHRATSSRQHRSVTCFIASNHLPRRAQLSIRHLTTRDVSFNAQRAIIFIHHYLSKMIMWTRQSISVSSRSCLWRYVLWCFTPNRDRSNLHNGSIESVLFARWQLYSRPMFGISDRLQLYYESRQQPRTPARDDLRHIIPTANKYSTKPDRDGRPNGEFATACNLPDTQENGRLFVALRRRVDIRRVSRSRAWRTTLISSHR